LIVPAKTSSPALLSAGIGSPGDVRLGYGRRADGAVRSDAFAALSDEKVADSQQNRRVLEIGSPLPFVPITSSSRESEAVRR